MSNMDTVENYEKNEDDLLTDSDVEPEDESAESYGGGSAYEKETIINFNNAEKEASVYSCNYHKRQELLTLAEEYPDDVKIIRNTEDFIEAVLPKRWIKIRPPRKLSEKEREALVKRGKALAQRRKEQKGEG